MKGIIILGIIVTLLVNGASAQPLLFLGDVSKISPLECIDRQCGLAGQACARNCPDSFNELSCKAACSEVMSTCLQSRCFFSLHKVLRAQSYCCDLNKFGCAYNENKGCVDSLDQPCSKNKGFQAFFEECINANLTKERGNATLNYSIQDLPTLASHGSCIDSSECSGGKICYQGSCVIVTEISPNHRHAVECLDDTDCPVSKFAHFICFNSSCVVRIQGFCRSVADCPKDNACDHLKCKAPQIVRETPVRIPTDPAIASLQSWALGRQGIMARIASVAGSPSDGTAPPVPGKVFSEGDAIATPEGMAVEVLLADGSRLVTMPGSFVALTNILAKGSDLNLKLDLGKGEVIFEIQPMHEVKHQVYVEAANSVIAVSQGSGSIIMYPQGAARVSVLENIAQINGIKIEKGMQVLKDPAGNIGQPSPIPPQELRRLQEAIQSSTPSNPPPYQEGSFIEKYGIISGIIVVILIAALWIFMKRKPKREAPESSAVSSKLNWSELGK